MTRDDLEKLLFEGESTYLDWKRDFPGELVPEHGQREAFDWELKDGFRFEVEVPP